MATRQPLTVFLATILLGMLVKRIAALDILYPFFEYPGPNWLTIKSLSAQYPTVNFVIVVNVNNGPGVARYETYFNAMTTLQAKNVRFLGYIDTNYGNCFSWAQASTVCQGADTSLTGVKRQMQQWVQYYGKALISGFFLDKIMPYQGVAPSTAYAKIIWDYGNMYSYAKSISSSFVVAGNAILVNSEFRQTQTKVADIIAVTQGGRTFTVNADDLSQATFNNIPPGYSKAMLVTLLLDQTDRAKAQIDQLVPLAKKWKVQYISTVRNFYQYPADVFPYLVKKLK